MDINKKFLIWELYCFIICLDVIFSDSLYVLLVKIICILGVVGECFFYKL